MIFYYSDRFNRIELIEGSSISEETIDKIRKMAPQGF